MILRTRILSQMDIAAGVAAGKVAGGRVATVAIDNMNFLVPVHVGAVVGCVAVSLISLIVVVSCTAASAATAAGPGAGAGRSDPMAHDQAPRGSDRMAHPSRPQTP